MSELLKQSGLKTMANAWRHYAAALIAGDDVGQGLCLLLWRSGPQVAADREIAVRALALIRLLRDPRGVVPARAGQVLIEAQTELVRLRESNPELVEALQ